MPGSTAITSAATSAIASFILGLRARGFAVGDITDDALTSVMNEALHEYSRYRPLIASTTFETVANQQSYTWTEIGDTAGITAIMCLYNPYQVGDVWDFARTMGTLGIPFESGSWHLPSQEMLEQIKAAVWADNNGGTGRQLDIEGGNILLNPCPENSGIDVYLLYTKRHTSVSTVKTSDRDVYLDLVDSLASDRMVVELANKAAAVLVKTPEYEIQTGEKIGYWRKRSKEMRDRFISKCQAGYAAAGRT